MNRMIYVLEPSKRNFPLDAGMSLNLTRDYKEVPMVINMDSFDFARAKSIDTGPLGMEIHHLVIDLKFGDFRCCVLPEEFKRVFGDFDMLEGRLESLHDYKHSNPNEVKE